MDGNGRWARQKGLARIYGHENGANTIRECIEGCIQTGVKYLTLYAFSTENWQRPKTEVSALMRLLETFLRERTPELVEKNVRLQAIGRLEELPKECQHQLKQAIEATATNSSLTLVLALSYSSRSEIVDAVKSIAAEVLAGSLPTSAINAETVSSHLYTRDLPDPDLLIRTSGELRISNFLLWQLSYTELYVTPKFWPDFRKEDLLEAIEDYGKRHRRFGGV